MRKIVIWEVLSQYHFADWLFHVSSMRKINKNKRMAIFLLSGSGKRAQVYPYIARLCGYPAAKTVSQTHLAKKWPHQVWQFFIELTLFP